MVVNLPEKMIGNSFGGKTKKQRAKKQISIKKVKSAFKGIMGPKNRMCVGRCMCLRKHGGKKVICKKWNFRALSRIF